jgi:exopolyphosphatase/guanosine-5'-triphosphate,3'-diphosphate pyrophosphatase
MKNSSASAMKAIAHSANLEMTSVGSSLGRGGMESPASVEVAGKASALSNKRTGPLTAARAMKIAAIDIGSNSIHMVTAQVSGGDFEILDRAKEMVGLARGTLTHGRLSDELMDRGFKALGTFKLLAERQGADPVLAVATSAVREAANGGEFLLRAWEELGLRIDVITGAEEARLIFEAARHAIDFRGQRPLVVDIGGGSVEIIQGIGGRIAWHESLKLGVTRLTERFIKSDPPKDSEISALRSHLRKSLSGVFAKARASRPSLLIGTSGTILNLTAMAAAIHEEKVPDRLHNHLLRGKDLDHLQEMVLAQSGDQRARIPGLDRKRVDLMPAGVVLAETLMEGLGFRELRACEWALREGLIVDFIAKHPEAVEAAEKVPDIRRRSVLQLAHRFGADEGHGRQVARLALQLFDGIKPLHELGATERELLEYAALLHDIGLSVSHSRHHRHSQYLITNGELRGFTPQEIHMIAAIARFHKGAPPKSSSEELADLSAKAREVTIKLTALLRLADGLDRSHHGIVQDIEMARHNGRMQVRLSTGGRDAELELWAAERKTEAWEKCFGSEIEFNIAERTEEGP